MRTAHELFSSCMPPASFSWNAARSGETAFFHTLKVSAPLLSLAGGASLHAALALPARIPRPSSSHLVPSARPPRFRRPPPWRLCAV